MKDALSQLSNRDREVVERRFGLGGQHRQTLEEVGKHLKLSRERIRQIELQVLPLLGRLRHLRETYEDLADFVSPPTPPTGSVRPFARPSSTSRE